MTLLPLTAALSPMAAEQGVDISKLAMAEMEFERQFAELKQWVADTRDNLPLLEGLV